VEERTTHVIPAVGLGEARKGGREGREGGEGGFVN